MKNFEVSYRHRNSLPASLLVFEAQNKKKLQYAQWLVGILGFLSSEVKQKQLLIFQAFQSSPCFFQLSTFNGQKKTGVILHPPNSPAVSLVAGLLRTNVWNLGSFLRRNDGPAGPFCKVQTWWPKKNKAEGQIFPKKHDTYHVRYLNK